MAPVGHRSEAFGATMTAEPRRVHHLTGDLDAPTHARRLTEEWWQSDPRRDEAILAVSELVANAVLHGKGTREEGVTLEFARTQTATRVTVSHRGWMFDVPRDPGRRGSGLDILRRVVDRWGVASDGPHVQVWFEMEASDTRHDHSASARAQDQSRR